jgi:hypothetical protein
MTWSPYPSEPRQWTATVVRDVLVLVALLLLAWLASKVHGWVTDVRVVTDALQGAGSSVQNGFGTAADALAGTPLVGDQLAGALQAAGDASGGNVVDLALAGQDAIDKLALGLALLTFLVPAVILLVLYVPMRIAQTRRLRASRLVFRDDLDPGRKQLLAQRAAFSLPVDHLVKFTQDPLGDLLRGEYDDLVHALMDDAGLAASAPAPTAE